MLFAHLEVFLLIISFRTLIIFLFLSFFMRLLGKRQVGQLEIGEFISALLLSELAAFPISDPDVPLIHALLPIGLIVCLEIFISCLCARFPFIKKVFDGCPAVLIRKGQVDPSAVSKARISPDEHLAQLRLKGCADPSKVDYALLEQNGQFSVVLKSESQPLSPSDIEKKPADCGYAVPLVICGRINRSGLDAIGITERELKKKIGNVATSEILLFTSDDCGNEYMVRYDKKEER